jgi:cyclopropane-fatty-acyl-phospholipid synthase
MAGYSSRTEDPSVAQILRLVQSLLRDMHPRDFDIELWDGTRWIGDPKQFHRFTWRISNPGIIWDVLRSSNRQIALGEAFIRGDFDIVGDLEAAFPLADYLISKEWSAAEVLRLLATGVLTEREQRKLIALRPRFSGKVHSRGRDQAAVSYHYDVSNDFYRLWLDRNMVYSCADFENAADDLDAAQVQKMNQICTKLELRPGETLVDIGCGWGGLIVYAAREFGVRAIGITISDAQADFAQRRIHAEGLSDRCAVRTLDYRDVSQLGGCDKLASVGMVEHVGASKLAEYFRRTFDMLRPGGIFLLSGIGRAGNRPLSDQPTFTDVYVFPDGELETIGTMLDHAESAGFEVCSLDNFRENYARTTSHWLHRLEAKAAEAVSIVGKTRYRTWRLYLAGSAYYFRKSWLGLYQTLLRKNSLAG